MKQPFNWDESDLSLVSLWLPSASSHEQIIIAYPDRWRSKRPVTTMQCSQRSSQRVRDYRHDMSHVDSMISSLMTLPFVPCNLYKHMELPPALISDRLTHFCFCFTIPHNRFPLGHLAPAQALNSQTCTSRPP
jgi:hypothetical protein